MATPAKAEREASQQLIPLNPCMEGASLNLFTGEIHLPPEVTESMQLIQRHLVDMKTVFYQPDLLTANHDPQRIVHRIYRYVGDTEIMVQAGLKYDITVILPGDWGSQLPTTTGHYHMPLEQGKSASPDFYQLLYGQALAILQRETVDGTEVKLLRPMPGEWMLFPSQYAHSVINIGHEPAAFANICVRKPHLNYEPIVEKRGMAYYVLQEGMSGYRLERNTNYKRIVSLTYGRSMVRIPDLEHIVGKSFYWLLTQKTSSLGFLVDPDSFPDIFDPDPIEPANSV